MQQLMSDTATKLARYITEGQQMLAISRATRRPFLHLTYEQMVADPDGTLEQVAHLLGHGERLSAIANTNAIKVPDRRPGLSSAEVRKLFLRYIEGTPSS